MYPCNLSFFDVANLKTSSQSGGQPFELLAPDNRYVFVSSQTHIQELNNAPDTVLSLQAASKQVGTPNTCSKGIHLS